MDGIVAGDDEIFEDVFLFVTDDSTVFEVGGGTEPTGDALFCNEKEYSYYRMRHGCKRIISKLNRSAKNLPQLSSSSQNGYSHKMCPFV